MAAKEGSLHELFYREDVVKGPSDRRFGFTFAVIFAVLGLLSVWRHSTHGFYLFAVAVAFAIITIVHAAALGPLNKFWLKFSLLLHAIVSPIVMALMFFAVFVPMGLLLRALGKDPLRRKRNPAAKSYWIIRDLPCPAPESMKQQF
jgi:apolipoprotein N-acyltransferase